MCQHCGSSIHKEAVVNADISKWTLEWLLEQGYNTVTWRYSWWGEEPCWGCMLLDGCKWKLKEFIGDGLPLPHEAPIYDTSHPGCRCILEVTGPKRKKLPVVHVGANG